MVVEAVPFNFPRTGRMAVTADRAGNLSVSFSYLNGHGAVVSQSAGERLFRLVVLDENGEPDYLPAITGDGVKVVEYLTAEEVDVLLIRISGLRRGVNWS